MTSTLLQAAEESSYSGPEPILLGIFAFVILLGLLAITVVFGHGRPHH